MGPENTLISEAIRRKQLPSKLYKYRDNSKRTDEILENAKFWFASADSFNDPFDSNLSMNPSYRISDLRKYLISAGMPLTDVRKQITAAKKKPKIFSKFADQAAEQSKKERGILSMSCNKDSILMWSHYSSNHEGMVIEVDVIKDLDFFQLPIKVKYQNSYTPISYFVDSEKAVIQNISTKSSQWEYEDEVRIMKKRTGLFEIKREAITGIYFGCKAPDKRIKEIQALCRNFGYTRIKYYRAEKRYGKFELSFSKIT